MENPRDDDKPKAIPRRLEVYHSETSPLVDFYSADMFDGLLKVVDGMGTREEIFQRILEPIGQPNHNRGLAPGG